MVLERDDFVLNNQVIRELSDGEQDVVANILDAYLVPHMWGQDFGGSTSGPNEPQILLLRDGSDLYHEIKQRIEKELDEKFALIQPDELTTLRAFFTKETNEGRRYSFVP